MHLKFYSELQVNVKKMNVTNWKKMYWFLFFPFYYQNAQYR